MPMPKIQIKHRRNGAVLYEAEVGDNVAPRGHLRAAVQMAVTARANLTGANLAGAYLADANLTGANLAGADLAGADLAGAYLADANLTGANLAGAYLADADLAGAYLAGAYLAGANLAGANLADADLAGAYLAGAYLADADLAGAYLAGAYLARANLADADLASARVDLERVLAAAPAEAPGVLAALRAGRIDGSVYEGDCACLVGTIAKIRGCSYRDLDHDAASPIERLFRAIRPGHVPAINPVAKIVEGWTEEWIAAHPAPAPTGPEAA